MGRNICIYDIESTGTDTGKDRIVQIAILIVNEELEVVHPLASSLVNPEMPIHPKATLVHGITDEIAATAPTFSQIANSLYEAIKDCDLCFFNGIKFDLPMLIEEFARAGINFSYEGKRLLDAYQVFIKKERRDLTAALKFYAGKEMQNAHEAGADVMATLEIMRGQLTKYEDIKTLDDINAIAEPENRCDLAGKFYKEDGIVRFGFGPHYQKDVREEAGFLAWMLTKDFPNDTMKYVEKLLREIAEENKSKADVPQTDPRNPNF